MRVPLANSPCMIFHRNHKHKHKHRNQDMKSESVVKYHTLRCQSQGVKNLPQSHTSKSQNWETLLVHEIHRRSSFLQGLLSKQSMQTKPQSATAKPPCSSSSPSSAHGAYPRQLPTAFPSLTSPRVPSTINRVYTLAHPDEAIFGFDLASSIVLPLQGFWNTVIYIVTSLAACKELLQHIKAVLFCRPRPPLPHHKPRRGSSMTLSRTNRQALGSDDGRADMTMSMEGKTRDAHHTYSGDSTDDEILIQRNPEPGFHAR